MIAWLWAWGPAIAQMVAIYLFSDTSNVPDLPAGLSSYTGHFIGYAVLGPLALRAFARARWQGVTRGAAWRALFLASAYGVTDEIHQSFVALRTPSVSDWAADTVGAAAGVLLVMWMARGRRGRGERDV